MLWEAVHDVVLGLVLTGAIAGGKAWVHRTPPRPRLTGMALVLRSAKDDYVAGKIDVLELESRVQKALEARTAPPAGMGGYYPPVAYYDRDGNVWPPG